MKKCKYFQILEETLNNVLAEIEKEHEFEIERWKSQYSLADADRDALYQLIRREDMVYNEKCRIADIIYKHGFNLRKDNEEENIPTNN